MINHHQVSSHSAKSDGQRIKNWTIVIMAVLILVPSLLGFAAKFLEFVHTFQGAADGAFAITPILNYLLASLGFLCLLIWAISNGMFHDVERPKYSMLEREKALDKASLECESLDWEPHRHSSQEPRHA